MSTPTRSYVRSVKTAHLRGRTRYLDRMLENYIPEPNTGCWLWLGYLDWRGYGKTERGRAHRVFWQHHRGPIPDGMSVLHRCDTRACVNPSHLFLGDQIDNMRDMAAKGRAAKGFAKTLDDAALAAIERRRLAGESVADMAAEVGLSAGYLRLRLQRLRTERLAGHSCPTCGGSGVVSAQALADALKGGT